MNEDAVQNDNEQQVLCCVVCGSEAKRRRQSTAYVNDELNFVIACDDCFKEIEEYWMERWDDYWSSVL